jgi:RHS repeat-associated protein
VLPIELTYTPHGQLLQVSQGTRLTTYNYFNSGAAAEYLESVTNALGEVVRFERDALGRPTLQTDADLLQTSFSYDPSGGIATVTPPGRPVHAQSFDSLGYQLSYTPPSVPGEPTGTVGFQYDLDRQLKARQRADGSSVSMTYRNDGKLDLITTPQGAYDYDYGLGTCEGCAPGAIKSVMSPSGVTQQFTYDGALPKEQTWNGAVTGQLGWTYDSDFRIASESVGSTSIKYGYDADGLVTCASPTSCAAPGADALRVAWDPQVARVSAITLGSVSETRTYNEYGELATIQVNNGSTPLFFESVHSADHPRDALGRIAVKSETTPTGTVEWTYQYDHAGRLQRTLKDGELYESLTYDGNGNRTGRSTADDTLAATYDERDRLLTYGNFAYTYTPDGERRTKTDTTTGEVTTYTYDALGNLSSVRLPSGDLIEYVHDGVSRRVAKKRNGVVVSRWIYRDALRISAELDANGAVVTRYVYASRSAVPDYVVTAAGTFRLVSDHLGSPRALVNIASGQVATAVEYDAWGSVLTQSGDPWTLPFGFGGGHFDNDSGLVRFGARVYDPESGHWLSRDPILFDGGQANLYLYVNGDPVNNRDASGLDIWIEGASGNEPLGHQSINIGDPFGAYESFSFAAANGGLVYEDVEKGGPIQRFLNTTPAQDSQAINEIFRQEAADNARWYTPLNTCRDYSQSKFDTFQRMFGGETTPPERAATPLNAWGYLRIFGITGLSSTLTSLR